MKEYKLILAILLKNGFRATGKGKSKTKQWLVAGLSMLPLLVIICVMLATTAVLCANKGILGELITCVIAGTQLFAFFFAIQGILSTLYLADDNAFLASLPARPTAIYFAKMTQLYLSELLLSAYVLVPALITMSISAAVSGFSVFPLFYPLILPIVLLAPVLPLALATILSMPLMWLAKFFKRRAAMGTVVSLVLFAALFGVYYAVIPNFGEYATVDSLSNTAITVLKTIANVFYPNKTVVFTALGINGGVNFGISLAIYVGLLGLIFLLTHFLYNKAVAAQLENFGTHEVKKTELKQRKKVIALMSRDFKSIVRYPGLALSSFMNILLAPIMLGVMSVYTGESATGLIPVGENAKIITDLVQVGLAFLYSVMLNSGVNSTAGLAFTREGGSFYIMKHLPIEPKDAVKAKLYFANLVSAVGIVPLIVLVAVLMKVSWYSSLLFGVCMLLISSGVNAFGIYMDMRRPNLDWKDISEIQRNNFYMLLPFVLCLATGAILLVLACVFSATGALLGEIGSVFVFWAIAIVIGLLISIGFYYLLMKKGVELYDSMGENMIQPRAGKQLNNTFNKNGRFLG